MLVDVSHRHAAPTSLRILMWALRGASGTFLSMTGEQSQDRRCLAVAAKPYASSSPSFLDTASQQRAQVHPRAWKAPAHNGLPPPQHAVFRGVTPAANVCDLGAGAPKCSRPLAMLGDEHMQLFNGRSLPSQPVLSLIAPLSDVRFCAVPASRNDTARRLLVDQSSVLSAARSGLYFVCRSGSQTSVHLLKPKSNGR
jgi:hypothetical protein